ncbi:MAG: palindromic element RPE1 domain-containing protein [Holosporales bacterium]|nr:palindromic element RPE1 domain-containing protein [Holosporales bacterium]
MGPLSKPSKSEFWEGDTEHTSGAYLDVREHSSTGSTYPKTDIVWKEVHYTSFQSARVLRFSKIIAPNISMKKDNH